MKVWGVVIVGLLLGFVGGLIFTWFIAPLEYVDTYPPMLDFKYRQEWIRMAAWSYGLEDNWERTQIRLLNLSTAEVGATAADVLDRATAQGQSVEILQRIAKLASAYGASGPGVALFGQAGADLVGTPAAPPLILPSLTPLRPTPAATQTPRPVPTATPTPSSLVLPPYRIVSQTLTCDTEPIIAVSVEVSRTVTVRGRPVQEQVGLPMREVWLIWDNGADRAITGLRPERGLGYADFDVAPGRSYNLYVDTPSGLPILTVQVEPCPPDEGTGWVSRSLVLREEPEPTLEATATLTPTVTPSE